MVQPPVRHDERELAAAIRFGVKRRPEQAFGEYYQGHRASCALGAAYEGLYRLPEEVVSSILKASTACSTAWRGHRGLPRGLQSA